jgi:hypothetical protein
MAWEESGVWVAVCIDFSLAVQADTADQVRQALHQQIAVYIEEACSLDADHAGELLTRRAPLHDVLRFHFWRAVLHRPRIRATLATWAQRVAPSVRAHLAYLEPLPLKPA